MKKTEFNQGVSFKIFMNDHLRADGNCTIYLRVIIDRKKREFNLKMAWPRSFFDGNRQMVLPRTAKDLEAEQVNMVLDEARGRSARIKLRYFTDGRILTLDLFQREFENYESRDNFLFFWREKLKYLTGKAIITDATAVRHQMNYNRLTGFLGAQDFLAMSDITPDLMLQYRTLAAQKKKAEAQYHRAYPENTAHLHQPCRS